jgi:hypothetical protein
LILIGVQAPVTPVSATNVIDVPREFARQQYLDFLGREPDAPGLAFWTNEITSCGGNAACIDRKRVNTSGAFFLSEEFQTTDFYVYRLYRGALERRPRYVEFLADLRLASRDIVVTDRLSPEAINRNKAILAERFVASADFRRIYDGLSNDAFIDRLFQTTGISPTPNERRELLDGLNAGRETRASVLRKIVDGIRATAPANGGVGVDQIFETRYGRLFYGQEFNRAFVLMQYFGYLRRDPDEDGYQFWLAKLNRFGNFTDAEMVRSFIVSTEYRSRFGRP